MEDLLHSAPNWVVCFDGWAYLDLKSQHIHKIAALAANMRVHTDETSKDNSDYTAPLCAANSAIVHVMLRFQVQVCPSIEELNPSVCA